MRILYLNPSAEMGGAETSLLELLASVRAAAADWQLSLILGANGPLSVKAEAIGVFVQVVPMPAELLSQGDWKGSSLPGLATGFIAALNYARRLRRIVRRQQPELIHATGFKMHLLAAWIRPRGVPLVWHVHDYVRPRPVMSRLLRLHARRCSSLIVNSHSVAEDVRSTIGESMQIDTVYNAIDSRRFSPEGGRLNLDFLGGVPNATHSAIRVGMVGTFARWKGHRIFLEALSLLPRSMRVRGYIIGGPIYQTAGSQYTISDLRSEAARLGLDENRVIFTGFIDDVASGIRALDIVIHASTEPEPFGMVIVEGMSCAKPVIASRAGGAIEIFEDGISAVSYSPGDSKALAEEILRLASDENLRTQLGRAGRARVERCFNGQRLAGELTMIYKRFRSDVLKENPALLTTQP